MLRRFLLCVSSVLILSTGALAADAKPKADGKAKPAAKAKAKPKAKPAPKANPCAKAEALFAEAQGKAGRRAKITKAALPKVDEAVAELDTVLAAKQRVSRRSFEGLFWAAAGARDDLMDFEKSLALYQKILDYRDRGQWDRNAKLGMARTYRAMRQFDKAKALYDAVAVENEAETLLPVAEMTLVDLGQTDKGLKLYEAALMNEKIHPAVRYRTAFDLAARALREGKRDEALAWYAKVEAMPCSSDRDRMRYLPMAWIAMGQVEQSRGALDKAKALYAKARDLEGGEMRYRVEARGAIENIEYFE